jgi:hypothetical protein
MAWPLKQIHALQSSSKAVHIINKGSLSLHAQQGVFAINAWIAHNRK